MGYIDEPWVGPVVSVICMFIKWNIAASFIVAYVQAMELFPTCVRQSGVGFFSTISQIISVGGPYVIALGITDLKLPETIKEATNFGRRDGYFSFKPQRY